MGGLVEDLLLLAELDRGRPLRAEPVDLHRICADAVGDSNAVRARPPADAGAGRRRSWCWATASAWRRWPTTSCATRWPTRRRGPRCGVDGRRPGAHGVHPGGRRRAGDPARRGRPRLRPLLPGRPVPLGGGDGAGAGHRAGHRRGAARDGRGRRPTPRAAGATPAWSASRWPPPTSRRPTARPSPSPVPSAHRSSTDDPGDHRLEHGGQLDVGLLGLGGGVGAGDDARAGAQRRPRAAVGVRAGRCGCRSSTRRRRRRRPADRARPSSPARRPRAPR